MELGMIGLGRMGGNMAQRLLRGGHQVVGFDPDAGARATLEAEGGGSADSLQALVAALPAPRALWMMVPAGKITDATVEALPGLLSAGADCYTVGVLPTPRATPACLLASTCARFLSTEAL